MGTKKVWAGMYGGHYSAIVFFLKLPFRSQDKDHGGFNGNWYDPGDSRNKDLVCGSMWLSDFKELYPDIDIGEPKDIEITSLIQLELTTYWEIDHDMVRMREINTSVDGY